MHRDDSREETLSVPRRFEARMRASGRGPKCQSAAIRAFGSVRTGGGPRSVGDAFADALAVVSPFSAYVGRECESTEFSRKRV